MHLIIFLCACLICFAAELLTRFSMPDAISSMYYDDIEMPEESISALEVMDLSSLNSHIRDLNVYMDQEDPQLFLKFKDNNSLNIHSIEIKLRKSYLFDLTAVLYYPKETGEYVEACKTVYMLPKGKKSIFFVIPEDVTYKMHGFRVDIDEDYSIEDILISQEELNNEYRTLEHQEPRSLLIYFLVVFIVLECIYFVFPEFLRLVKGQWEVRKNIAAVLLLMIGSALVGMGAGFVFSQVLGKDYAWFWSGLFGLYSVLFAYQIYLLLQKVSAENLVIKSENYKKNRILFWVCVVIFCLLIVFEWVDGAENSPDLAYRVRFWIPFVFAGAETIMLALLFQKYIINVKEEQISFLKVYPYILLILGLGYMFVFLPFISPDETSHYVSAYRVSNLILGKVGQLGDNRLLMRMEDYYFYDHASRFMNAEYYKQITENLHLFSQKSGFIIIDAPMVTNAIFSYCTTGIGIAAARFLHLSGTMTFWTGRFANLVFFILVMRHLMKKIPFGRTALFTIAALPMTLHMAASYSYDVTTLCFVALFVTQVMCMICTDNKITQRDYNLCMIYGALMAPSKLAYIPLLFLVLLIPKEKLSRSSGRALRRELMVIGAGLASAVVIMLAVNLLGADPAIREMVEENASVNMLTWIHEPGYTFSWITGHPWKYFLMNIRTLIAMTDYYFFTMLGSSLGWLDINVPKVYTIGCFLLFLLAVNIRDDASEGVRISLGKKIWILILCGGSIFITMLAMMLNWTPMSYNYITGVQGRYFIPLLIPIIWLVRNNVIQIRSVIRKYIVLFSTLINVWLLICIFAQTLLGTAL